MLFLLGPPGETIRVPANVEVGDGMPGEPGMMGPRGPPGPPGERGASGLYIINSQCIQALYTQYIDLNKLKIIYPAF